MRDKDYGIIISKLDYSETSYILKIFTSKNGLSSFLFKGAKKKKNQFKIFPLSIVELEYSKGIKSDLFLLNSIGTYVNTKENVFDPIKSSIVFFLNEILQKTLKTNEPNVELLSFFINRLKYLDLIRNPINFHLCFMIDYSSYLGFYPQMELSDLEKVIFDLKEGIFQKGKPNHEFYVINQESKVLAELLGMKFDEDIEPNLQGVKRIRLLEILVEYYKLQIEGFGNCKTLEVLETIFHD